MARQPPEWYASQRFARTLPWRAVVEVMPRENGWHDERLECGHINRIPSNHAKKRRCWECGPEATV